MFAKRMMLAAVLSGLLFGTTACTDGYGYSGVSVGAGSAFYDDPYYAGGYGNGYYGWYDNYYYPGTGAYVYDRYRRAYPWNDGQRRYWEQRRYGVTDRDVRANWRDFRRDVRRERRDYRGDVRADRDAYRNGQITRERFRHERSEARRAYRQDVGRDFRDLRRQNRAEGYRTPRPDRAFRPRPERRPR